MKLNLKFVSKIPNQNRNNEIIFLKQKNQKSKYLKPLNKSIFSKAIYEKNFS